MGFEHSPDAFAPSTDIIMTDTIKVGDLIALFLKQIDVTTAFGVISVHNIPILDAVGRGNLLRFVTARGEAGAGHMADAYARASGGLGVLISSTGPGAANTCGALVEARFAGTPLLHLTGQTATPNIDRGQGTVHDVPDQLGMLRSVSKAAYRVRSAETALGVLVRAATDALTPPMGPVSVEIPIDIQRMEIPRPAALDNLTLPIPEPRKPDSASLDALVDMVSKARRPLLWTGNGAKHARGAVQRLMALGIPHITSWNGRGVVPETDAMTLGAINNLGEVQEFYKSVDLLIVAGSRLRGHETMDMSIQLPENRVQIDIDPQADGRTYTSDLFVCADSAPALDALADGLKGKLEIESGYAGEIAALKAEANENLRKAQAPYDSFPGDLRAVMPDDAIWVRDITLANSTWGNRILHLNDPTQNIYPIGAAIGPGMSLGIGAAIGSGGRKVVCISGDGGFFLNLTELWTAAQERADAVFIVMNDRGYGVIRHIQDSLYEGRRYFHDIKGPNFEELAKVAGIPYGKVSKASELGDKVATAIAIDGPALVEVDMEAIGDYPPYFKPPPFAQKEKASE
jgi:acetolactate synthase-1/2/3 large subunit